MEINAIRGLAIIPAKTDSKRLKKKNLRVIAGKTLGRDTYGSPTLSDQAALKCPSLKIGPGDSTRSHTADEYIFVREIEEGITLYIDLLNQIL